LLDSELFKRLREVYERRQSLGLNAEQMRLVEKTYQDFERSGADLSDEKKQRLREMDERLSQLTPVFRDNVLKAMNAFELWIDKKEDLDGLPAGQVTAAREAAAAKGQPEKWLFTLHRPSYGPFQDYSTRRELRERLWRAQSGRALGGDFDNRATLLEIANLQKEKAQLLGSKSYAEYALKTRMAETPAEVTAFLQRLSDAAKPAAQREMKEVTELARSMGGPEVLQPWDITFYSERLKEKRYAFDEEQLRPYLKLENVVNGVFEHARRLFGLKFVASKEYPVYHPDVQVYEVTKEKSGEFIGLFYCDFFPRESKQGGAWMTAFREQGGFRGERVRPHVSIVCNFTKPTADQPSLLNFEEMRTLFHEFGHALHGLLSQVEHRTLGGTNVYLDFVELPSQILENWTTEEESLKLFAFHYKTGEVIPRHLVDALKRARRFFAGYWAMRQLNFATLDMAWYTDPPPRGADVEAFEEQATASTRIAPAVKGSNISTSFNHIFGGGYASGYYSYKWAEALDADAFELFKEKGVFDRDTAQRFEEFILSKGGSDHPMRLYEQFRGRKADPLALLRRDGLIQ
jgi:peptidyl-dipeptidase Dcp